MAHYQHDSPFHGRVQQGTSTSPCDEAALMARLYHHRERAALDELLERYWGQTVAYVNGLLDSWDGAEDVAQETFFWIWEHPVDWRGGTGLTTYIYRIARHRALDRIKAVRIRRRLRGPVRTQYEHQLRSPNPLELVERTELRAALDGAVASLPPRRREVFTLGHLHELPHKAIAEIMGISVQTVKNQMSDALADIRKALKPLRE